MITLKSQSSETLTTKTYSLTVEGKEVTYIEYLNDKSKVIDFVLRNADGEDIAGADTGSILLEQVQGFVDNLTPIS